MTIKCLAFDLDGTLLLDESKRMDPRTVDSIQRAMAQGMHVVMELRFRKFVSNLV